MAEFTATPKEIAEAQLSFDWLIPWGPTKQLLVTPEAGQVMAINEDSVRALIDQGELEAHKFNIQGDSNRLNNRVTRRSVAVWLMRTAKYGQDEILHGMVEVFKRLAPEQRRTLIARLSKL